MSGKAFAVIVLLVLGLLAWFISSAMIMGGD
jgi:hypothetical protein